jgi:PAS domain-containing protein
LAQHPIEIILLRHWASYMAIPIWIADPEGNLLYCNEPAESITGVHFEADGDVPVETHAARFDVSAPDGSPLMTEDLPISMALSKQMPSHRAMQIRGLDGVWRSIEVTALPLIGQNGRHLGALATFWEVGP